MNLPDNSLSYIDSSVRYMEYNESMNEIQTIVHDKIYSSISRVDELNMTSFYKNNRLLLVKDIVSDIINSPRVLVSLALELMDSDVSDDDFIHFVNSYSDCNDIIKS